jgi:CheY-like chemotaxis protein
MNERRQQPRIMKMPASKISILLVDAIAERRALRKKIMALHGVEVIGANDLAEAVSIWHRDRYNIVLVDIRADHRGCVAFRDEIKKEAPDQIVAFLVGKPKFIDLEPSPGSYISEEHGVEWGDSLRKAVRESCNSLSQRNSFVEASWRIAAGRRMNGTTQNAAAADLPAKIEAAPPAAMAIDFIPDLSLVADDGDGLGGILDRLA